MLESSRFHANGSHNWRVFALDTFEIHDDEINVEEIMQKIRENIKRRKETSAYPDVEPQIFSRQTEQVADNNNDLFIWADEMKRDLDYVNSNWDIQNNRYSISSHRPYSGKFLIKGRELIHGEVKRYVDPMIWRQKEFNANTVRILNEDTKKIFEISDKLDEQIGLVRSEISTQLRSIVADMDQEIENKAWLANILDKNIAKYSGIETSVPTQESGLNYFLFEDQFRGSRADIKQKQTAFVHYLEGCRNVLDIGCGRGEFLELLREHGIEGHGVDVNGDMVDFCRSKGLNVEKIDAISYLEKIEDKSLDGILIDQVVEHLEPDYLIEMLRLCHKKLNFGYHILIETVNPLSLVSLANFYLDMSHKKPIHPETLKFLMASMNFRDIETKFFSPVPDEIRLKKINIEGVEERDRHSMEVYNHNIDMLNNILYGAQDYMVIGKK
jgi:2-polyprenyl-3-methyl-5-hydroxy-6-metoxy-1,4-benzoquinol methylase